ncbi:unnamed protein product, partial [Adineta ricciae]
RPIPIPPIPIPPIPIPTNTNTNQYYPVPIPILQYRIGIVTSLSTSLLRAVRYSSTLQAFESERRSIKLMLLYNGHQHTADNRKQKPSQSGQTTCTSPNQAWTQTAST